MKKALPGDRDILGRMYRYLFVRTLTGSVSPGYWRNPLEKNFRYGPKEDAATWGGKEQAAFRKLAEAAAEGIKTIGRATKDYKKGQIEKVKQHGHELAGIDGKIEMAGLANPELMPIVRLFTMGKGNMGETSIEVMLEQTKMLYTKAKVAAELMAGMLEEFIGAQK